MHQQVEVDQSIVNVVGGKGGRIAQLGEGGGVDGGVVPREGDVFGDEFEDRREEFVLGRGTLILNKSESGEAAIELWW